MDERADRLDSTFLTAATIAHDLVGRAEVTDGWQQPSALPKMSVGALACHLGQQAVRAAEVLPLRTDVRPLDSAQEHYARAAWVRSSSPDDPVNDRSADDAAAEQGPAALDVRVADAITAVRGRFAAGTAQAVVLIPWQGWSLRREDFLLTRLLEIVVHADDLAVSVGIPTPLFPDDVFTPVQDLLVRLAVARHGQSAVVGTLSRRERARQITAF